MDISKESLFQIGAIVLNGLRFLNTFIELDYNNAMFLIRSFCDCSDEDQLINSPTRTQQVHFSNHGDESDVTIDTSHGRHGDVPVQTHNLGDHDNAVQR